MATVLIMALAPGQNLVNTEHDAPVLFDNDNFDIKDTIWGGDAIRINHKKTPHGEIITPLAPDAKTLTITGEYLAADHVVDGKFVYPFARLDRWRRKLYQTTVTWPDANNPWTTEELADLTGISGFDALFAATPSTFIEIQGSDTLSFFIVSITPKFTQYFSSTPQIVPFTIKLIEASTGQAR